MKTFDHPNPFLCNRLDQIHRILAKEDGQLGFDFTTVPETERTEGILFVRDYSCSPPRVQSWRITNNMAKWDSFVPQTAESILKYWNRKRELRNAV